MVTPFALYTTLGAMGYVTAGLIKDATAAGAVRAYRDAQGYNRDRQEQLEQLWYHSGPYVEIPWETLKRASIELFGVDAQMIRRQKTPYGKDWPMVSCKQYVREVAKKEGWKYYDANEEFQDFGFQCALVGGRKALKNYEAMQSARVVHRLNILKVTNPKQYEIEMERVREKWRASDRRLMRDIAIFLGIPFVILVLLWTMF